jgi:poly(hydroxyalkanoate) depolymerase family esterase
MRWVRYQLFSSGSLRVPLAIRRYLGTEITPGRWINQRYSGPAGSRQYDVYLPAGLPARGKLPMVLLLHGCGQTAVEFATQTGFTSAADTNGFVVVAPRQEIRHQIQRCWRWYESAHQRRDAGEPAILKGIVDDVLAEEAGWRIDRRRVYVAGLSAGGAMALILATTYPDVFAASGVHSATAYRSATQSFRALGAMAARGSAPSNGGIGGMAPVVLIHGTDDRVVRPPNADRIVAQWLASRDADRPTGLNRVKPLATTRSFVVDNRRCIRTRWYTARGRRVLEYWRIDGLGHAWSGGHSSGAYIDRKGPPSATVMWTFFARHRLSVGPAEVAEVDDQDLAWDIRLG